MASKKDREKESKDDELEAGPEVAAAASSYEFKVCHLSGARGLQQ